MSGKISDALAAFIWADDETTARAAGEAVKTDLEAGRVVFNSKAGNMTAREQREAGMPKPSERPGTFAAPSSARQAAPSPDGSALAAARRKAQLEQDRYDEAFARNRAAQEELERLETENYQESWNADEPPDYDFDPVTPMPEDQVAEAQAAYDQREAAVFETNSLSAQAWEAMQP